MKWWLIIVRGCQTGIALTNAINNETWIMTLDVFGRMIVWVDTHVNAGTEALFTLGEVLNGDVTPEFSMGHQSTWIIPVWSSPNPYDQQGSTRPGKL